MDWESNCLNRRRTDDFEEDQNLEQATVFATWSYAIGGCWCGRATREKSLEARDRFRFATLFPPSDTRLCATSAMDSILRWIKCHLLPRGVPSKHLSLSSFLSWNFFFFFGQPLTVGLEFFWTMVGLEFWCQEMRAEPKYLINIILLLRQLLRLLLFLFFIFKETQIL